MKKLLSFFAAGLLAVGSLGVISCSGDLQNNDVQPLAVTGIAGLEVVPMTIPSGGDGSEQYLTFRVSEDFTFKGLDGKDKALKDGWGGLSSIQFKIVPSTELNEKREPNWKVDWGGATDSGNIFVKPGADEYTDLLMRGDPGTTAAGPSNVQIDGAVMNEEYTIRVKYSGNKVSVKIEGVSEDPTEMKINIVGESKNFPAKDEDKKDLTYTMNKAGKVYTYQFISVADETIEFNLSNPMSGTFYASSTEKGELELESAGKKNLSYDVKKNVEYKITVDLSSVLKPTIKVEVVDMLKDASLKADYKYDDPSSAYAVTYSTGKFKAEREEINLVVVRHDGGIFGADTTSTIKVGDEAVDMKYFPVKDANDAKTIKIKGLKIGTVYKVVLTPDNNNCALTIKVIECPTADLANKQFIIAGTMNSWPKSDPTKVFTKNADDSYSTTFTASATSHQFAIHEENNWDLKYCSGAKVKSDGTLATLDNGGDNAEFTDLESGKTYKVTITAGPDELYVKCVENK